MVRSSDQSATRGVKQGGTSSGDLFKLSTNNKLVQLSLLGLGIMICMITLAVIAYMDDKVLFLSTPEDLQVLINRPVVLSKRGGGMPTNPKRPGYWRFSPRIMFLKTRLTRNGLLMGCRLRQCPKPLIWVWLDQQMPTQICSILSRIGAHKRTSYMSLSLRMAKNHRSSIKVIIRIKETYCALILLSGLCIIVMSLAEIRVIKFHRRKTMTDYQVIPLDCHPHQTLLDWKLAC